ncbi:MAG: hypothetical protein NC098_03795 [Lachnoclostridium sp.]|nr:hypothetical protein [Lachnoclostridium sp.]
MDSESPLIIGIVLVIVAVALYFLHKKLHNYLDNEFRSNPIVPYPNGNGKNLKLVLINGCGFTMCGCYREHHLDDRYSYACYYTLHILFVPILAIRCYRVIPADDGGYYVLGSEKTDFRELVCMFMLFLVWPCAIIGAIALFNDFF